MSTFNPLFETLLATDTALFVDVFNKLSDADRSKALFEHEWEYSTTTGGCTMLNVACIRNNYHIVTLILEFGVKNGIDMHNYINKSEKITKLLCIMLVLTVTLKCAKFC